MDASSVPGRCPTETAAFRMRDSITQMLVAIASACLVIGAFLRGHFLLGIVAGVAFALIASATIFVLIRVAFTKRKFHKLRIAFASILSLGVFSILSMLDRFNSDLTSIIEGHQLQRTACSNLNSIFSSDSRFADLDFECGYRKCIIVTVDGSIQSQADLLELRDQIFERCPELSSRWLFWRLKIAEAGIVYNDCDLTIFGEPESDAGDAE